jgi:hypothetical protein
MAGWAGDCACAAAPNQSIPQAATVAAAERHHPMSTDDRKWVTRKEAAALARCSQDSIERTEKKHKLETRTNDAGATLLNLDDLVRVERVRADALTASKSGAECAELALAKEQVNQLRTEVGRQGGRLAEREAFLDMLRQQVKEKDHQIPRCHGQSASVTCHTTASARATWTMVLALALVTAGFRVVRPSVRR